LNSGPWHLPRFHAKPVLEVASIGIMTGMRPRREEPFVETAYSALHAPVVWIRMHP
jgi:hypothetical protein